MRRNLRKDKMLADKYGRRPTRYRLVFNGFTRDVTAFSETDAVAVVGLGAPLQVFPVQPEAKVHVSIGFAADVADDLRRAACDRLAERIAVRLFTDGAGAVARRLVHESDEGRMGAGWGRKAATWAIAEVLMTELSGARP